MCYGDLDAADDPRSGAEAPRPSGVCRSKPASGRRRAPGRTRPLDNYGACSHEIASEYGRSLLRPLPASLGHTFLNVGAQLHCASCEEVCPTVPSPLVVPLWGRDRERGGDDALSATLVPGTRTTASLASLGE